MNGRLPFHELHDAAIVLAVIRDQRPEPISEPSSDADLWAVARECWVGDAKMRPSMKRVFEELRKGPSYPGPGSSDRPDLRNPSSDNQATNGARDVQVQRAVSPFPIPLFLLQTKFVTG